MTQSELAALKEMPEEGWTPFGFGQPSETTRALIAMGYIEMDTVESDTCILWHARLTHRGKKALIQ